MLELRLLKDRIFAASNVMALPVYAGFLSLIYLLPLFLQREAGHSPLTVGLALFPQPLGVLVATQISGRFLYNRFGPRRLLIAGNVGALVLGLLIARIDLNTDLWLLRSLMFGRGLAMGLIFVPLQAAVYAGMEGRDLPRATAIFGTTRQIAPALGVAIASTVLAAGFGDAPTAATRVDSYQTAMTVSALLFAIGIPLAMRIRDEDAARTRGQVPAR
ncbi:MAG: MFS transporter [Acidimicrobiales bacterium]